MKVIGRFFLSVLFFLPGLPCLYAQKLSLNTTSVNSNSGLSQNSIQCILKDRYGFMWFGTQDGLNKYDGFKFTIYKNSKTDASSIPSNMVDAICEDASGNVWVGTRLGGISRYERSTDSFINYKHDSRDPNSLSNDNVHVIYKGSQGRLWIGTEDGLNLFDSKTGRFKRYPSSASLPGGLSSSNITAIFEDTSHNLWVGTVNGLNLLDTRMGTSVKYLDKTKSINGENNIITAIVEDDHKNIWIGTKKGLNLVNEKEKTYSYYPIEPDKNLAGNINSIFCLTKTQNNRFWIGSNTTLQLFDASTKKSIPIDEKTNGEGMMPNDGISALVEDNAGILWIGSTSVGIFKYDRNLSIFPAYMASLNNNPSARNIVRGIAEDAKGNLYLGTDFGMEYFNRAKGTYTLYKHDAKNKNTLSNNYVLTVLISKKTGLLWVGTYSSGLDCFDPKTQRFTHYPKGKGANQIDGKGIYALMEDRHGNIWFGPEDGGVYEYEQSTKKFKRYLHDDNNPNSVCDNTVQAMIEDVKGNIWMGGYSFGISILNPATNAFTHLNTHNSKLSSNVISAFYEDRKGNMWTGTMDGGLNCYEASTGQFKAYTEHDGVINNTINYIAGDIKGNIWVSTIQGIVQFDQVANKFKNYGYHNGLKSLEFNFGTGTILSDGEIVFGNINGFNIVDPNKLHFNYNKPVVAITGFELFNKPVAPNAKGSPLKKSIFSTREVSLNRSQSMFCIDFAALDYTIPENNTYAYKLDGFDNEWHYVGHERKATYTNLDPARYVFRVKAANESGIWSERETTLVINVVPPYWMTWWFRAAAICLFLGACYAFFLYRNRAVRKQKIALEKQVKIRTLEIEKQANDLLVLNDELQVQKEEIIGQSKELKEKTISLETLLDELTRQKDHEQQARLMAEIARKEADQANLAKSTFLATMSHEIRTPLNGILGMAALLAETGQTREQREYTSSIVKSGDSLLLVINDILDFSKIESGNLTLEPHEFDVRRCVEDVFELFSYLATEKALRLYHSIDESVPQYLVADSLRLRQVLTNLVSNALKFTQKGEIAVKITCEDTGTDKFNLIFEITDTGIGIKPEQLSKLFQAFNQGDSSITRKYGGTGLGLVICQRLIQLMGGDITVTSEYGAGSSFKFYINCSKASQAVLKDTFAPGAAANATADKKPLLSEDFALKYPMAILVAEDNLMNQKLILRILSKLGYKAQLANDGNEVLDNLSRNKYDLILMDVQMPNLDGLEATRVIRNMYGASPLIAAMTANALSEDRDNCFKAGMDFYLSKPLGIEALINKLIEVYEKSGVLKTRDAKSYI